ncbi:AIPR family protein [Sphingobium sp.]|uniref:AIPR family protein n=1 Tax=Sphingobium sp. TaxID=1912891 RepID=UPI003BB5931B
MATLLDWGNVDAAAGEIQSSLELESRREAFTFLVLSTILRIDLDEARACITDGPEDRGIDAVFLDERFGRRVIHLFQIKHHREYKRTNRNFPSSEIDKILSFITDCFEQTDGFLQTCNNILHQKVIDIWEFVRGGTCEVEVHFCSNGEKLVSDQKSRIESSLHRFKFINLYESDLDAISDSITHKHSVHREISLRVVDEQIFERTDGNVRGVIGTLRADDFIEAFTDKKNPLQLDPYLFEENVRVYLGEQNDINKRIYDTAISSESTMFWYYNNGITIVCESFSHQPGFRNSPLTLSNPQVVNGGQTSHALFEASKSNFTMLSKVRILVRIIETRDKSLYAKVAEATNSQTPIRSRDLRSNDPMLVRLESSLRALGWVFDRKRNQNSSIPDHKKIDALKLGQIWLAYVRGEPDKAKTASDRIFGEYFPLIFDPMEMSANRVVSVWNLYKSLETGRRADLRTSRTGARSADERLMEGFWIVEGIYHLAYTVRRLAEQENIDIFDFDRVENLISKAQIRLSSFVAERPGISLYRLFRNSGTKNRLFLQSISDGQLDLDLGD